jgi:hypothetical protein
MGLKTRDETESSPEPLDLALERLYAAPLDGFIGLRRELAAAFRKAGNAAVSRDVAAAPKPSRTAWALNQVARRHPALLVAVLDARATALASQKGGDSEAVRASARAYRERVAAAVQAASQILREAGASGANATQSRRMGTTLQALAGGGDAAGRARLLAGRLVADVDVDDPFAGLEMGPARDRPRPEPLPADELAPRRAARAAAEATARARAVQREKDKKGQEVAKANVRIRALEERAAAARASARQAEIAATRAQSEADRARREVDAVEQQLIEARRALRALST